MQQDLTQEILNRLDALAAKLGTTVEQLWPVLLREQYALAVGGAVGCLTMIAACGLLAWAAKRAKWDNDGLNLTAVLSSIMVIPICVAALAIEIVPRLVAPEAAALRSLLSN